MAGQAAEGDVGVGLVARVFDGVAQQVFQRDAHQPRVALAVQPGFDVPADAAQRLAAALELQDAMRHVAQVHQFAPELALADARQRQQVGDQLAHAPGGGEHALEQLLFVRFQAVVQLLREQLREAVDGPQG